MPLSLFYSSLEAFRVLTALLQMTCLVEFSVFQDIVVKRGLDFRNPNKKEGGVKLLDIADQPIGYAAAKKRKKQQEAEEAKKAAGEKPDAKESAAKPEEAKPDAAANPTPDYAAGLNPATPAPPPPPAYAPPTPTPIQVLGNLLLSKHPARQVTS